MRSVAIRAGIAAAIAIAGFAIAVAALNATLYSPVGFVQGYLDALQQRDAAAALEIAGAPPSSSRRADLLQDAAISPGVIRKVVAGDEVDGVVPVTVTFDAAGRTSTANFEVLRGGSLLGLFSSWSFLQSPLATVEITVLNANSFTANGLDLRTVQQNSPVRYLVFSPGVLVLEHRSDLLVADPETVVIDQPGPIIAELRASASEAFIAQVQEQTDAYLADCATQQVLMPSGCPFGQQIADRIVSASAWSIVEAPRVRLEPTATPGVWTVPAADGVAHLVVDVKSIYDGDVETFDEDVPFRVGFTVTFVEERSIVITPQAG